MNWNRVSERVSVAYVDGRVQPSDQRQIRRNDGNRGNYEFRFNSNQGRTIVIRTEYPEWR